MSRGFGPATPGGGAFSVGTSANDILVTRHTANPVKRTYFICSNRNGDGGNSLGRLFEKNNGTSTVALLSNSAGTYDFVRAFASASGTWQWTRPAANVWSRLAIAYDCGSTANDPIVVQDGIRQNITESVTPSGAVTNNSDPYCIGNRQTDLQRHWDGYFLVFAMWDNVLLTISEMEALTRGADPEEIRPDALSCYIDMDGIVYDRYWGAPTLSGTLVHPSPALSSLLDDETMPIFKGATAATFKAAWARGANAVISSGARAA